MSAQIVSFNCVLKNRYGQFISSSVNREVLTSMPIEGALLNGLAKGLQRLEKGERRSISLSAEQAYGFYDPKKVILFPKKKIPDALNLRVGQSVSIHTKSGQICEYVVQHIYGEMIALDGNHPLAGQDLIFEIEAMDVRDATVDEIFDAQNLVARQLLH